METARPRHCLRRCPAGCRPLVGLVLLLVVGPLAMSPQAFVAAQPADVANRPVREIRFEGLQRVDKQLLLNQVLIKPGDALNPALVDRDIQNLTRLGLFSPPLRARVEPNADGTVTLVYVVIERVVLKDVQIVGNKAYGDQALLSKVVLRKGDPHDSFLVNKARDQVLRHYQDNGYVQASVTVDKRALEEDGILILRVREGPRVRLQRILFDGNRAFTGEQLQSRIRSEPYAFIFKRGIFNQEELEQDRARLRQFYQQRGYLDVRVGSPEVVFSEDQREASATFSIDEGVQYTVGSISFEGNKVFSEAQLRDAIPLKLGDVFSVEKLRATDRRLRDLYGKLGYYGKQGTPVQIQQVPQPPKVALRITISEPVQARTGEVIVRGNALTQDKVFRRQLRGLEPGRLLDTTGIEVSERRIRGTALAREAKITVLGEEDDEARDVLVEIEEAGTGSISFGAAVSSDSGVFGAIELTQRNFDIQDAPESWGEFFSGRAFRGAGQYFSISLQPGNEFSRYQVNFREPYLLESDYFLDTNFFLFNRDREEWEEERVGGTLGLGKRFGDVWSASVRGRYETVDLSDFDPDVPVDAVAVAGEKDVDSIGFFVTRSTVKTDRSFLPYEGTRVSGGIEQVGAFGNDFDFTRLTAQYRAHLTLDEDFFERKTTLTFRMNTGYIPDAGSVTVTPTAGPPAVISDIPLYERFYAGGHRTFRGFEFRGIGPRGIRNDLGVVGNDPVGGEFLFLMGAEYNFPVAEDFLRAVFFIDSGTIQDDIRFSDYRVTVGAGIRMRVPLLGSAPFAFDLAIPLADELGDETQVFSFDIALPF